MDISNEASWKECREHNTDPYGNAVIRFAEAWANVMEREMAAGRMLHDVAHAASREADTEGITGFMYGAAVCVLSDCWTHGEALRRWHNKDIQIGTEGEEANASGGVLNPALLCMSPK